LLDRVGIVIGKHRIAAFHRGHNLFALIRCHHLRRLLWSLLVCKQLLLKHLLSHLLFLESHLKLHSLLDLLSLLMLVSPINWELHIDRLVRVWLRLHRIRVKRDRLTIRGYLDFQLLHLVLFGEALIGFLAFICALIELRICGKLQIH
jgi:hypothetical protein